MTTFSYSAINAQGVTELTGGIHAPDLDAARDLLRQRGLLPQRVDSTGKKLTMRLGPVKKVNPKALQIFSRQFATLIEAGVSVVTSLAILHDQTVDKNLANSSSPSRERTSSPECTLEGARPASRRLQPPLRLDGRGRR